MRVENNEIINLNQYRYDKDLADELGVTPAEVRRLRAQGKLMDILIKKAMMDMRLNEGRY